MGVLPDGRVIIAGGCDGAKTESRFLSTRVHFCPLYTEQHKIPKHTMILTQTGSGQTPFYSNENELLPFFSFKIIAISIYLLMQATTTQRSIPPSAGTP
jgi:hypothetical protein